MSCDSYNKCIKHEMDNMVYPMDSKSLYSDRIYDEQTARSRCYALGPIEIREGFGASWNTIIKLLIVILLIYLVYELGKEFLNKKSVVQLGGFVNTPSPFSMSEFMP